MKNNSVKSKSLPVRVTWSELQHFEERYFCFDKWVPMCRMFGDIEEACEFCKLKLKSNAQVQRMSVQLIIIEAGQATKLGTNLTSSGRF